MDILGIVRRPFAVVLIVSLVLALFPGGALATTQTEVIASGSCGYGASWSLDELGTLTISGRGNMWDYPRSKDRPWDAFLTEITSIIVEKGVTGIGEYAFSDCNNLISVTVPESVTGMGAWAFSDCNGLTGVYISSLENWCNIDFANSNANPLYYGKNLYLNGELVENPVIPAGVTQIKNYAFYHCTTLTDVTLPDGVTGIGEGAFYGCSSLTGINLPQGVTDIGKSAFCDCSSLISITIPEGVTGISNWAFSGCSSLAGITIPQGVTDIGAYAFFGCYDLTGIHIPEGVTSIGRCAFSCCSGLTSIILPEGVTSIGEGAFNCCSRLTSIVIPESVTSIGNHAFYGCDELWHVLYTGTEEQWKAISRSSYYSAFADATRHYNAAGDDIYDVVSKEPTCTQKGSKTRTCSICNDTLEVSIATIEHSYEYQKTVLPTCTEPGYEEYRCACGKAYHLNKDSALGHTFDYYGMCTRCGSGQEIVIDLTDDCGDGWSGCAIEVYDGSHRLITTATILSGCSEEVKIPWDSTQSYSFLWIKGAYANECSFEISLNGELLISGKGNDYINRQVIYTIESVPTPEYETVAGSIVSFGEGEVTLTLTEAGKDQPLNTVTTDGQDYTLEALPGTYILTVSKPNHATRQYPLAVETEAVVLDVKICFRGDLTGDGRVTIADTSKLFTYVRGLTALTDYVLACADVDGSGKVNIADTSKIYAHVKGASPLW